MAAARIPSYLIDREFRRMRARGSSVDARSNDPLWKLLELRARIRLEQSGGIEPELVDADGKRRAANDLD